MTAICLIGARSGSVGVPGKNIRPLAGHPLLAYSIMAGLKAGLTVYVSTDSAEYADIAESYGANTIMRPEKFAQADSDDYQFVSHAVKVLQEAGGKFFDLIVHLRPTTPLRDPQFITFALHEIRYQTQAMSLRSVHEMAESAYKCMEVKGGRLIPLCGAPPSQVDLNAPRQTFPKTYHPNGYVDVLRTDFIRLHKTLHGAHVVPFVTPPMVEVDTEEDFGLLEYQVSRDPQLVERLFK